MKATCQCCPRTCGGNPRCVDAKNPTAVEPNADRNSWSTKDVSDDISPCACPRKKTGTGKHWVGLKRLDFENH